MKTKLYRKFVKMFCSDFNVSRETLFSRQLKKYAIGPHVFDPCTHLLVKDETKLHLLDVQKPLSSVWKCFDFKTRWLYKYWKHSHWRQFIQLKLDIGEKLENVLLDLAASLKVKKT